MWNWLVSRPRRAARRCCSTTARRSSAAASVLFDFADAEGMTHLRHLGQVHRRHRQGRPEAARDARSRRSCARCSPPARRWRPRASTTSTETSSRTCACRRSRGGTDIVSCFVLRQPDRCPVWRGEIQCRGPGHGGRGLRRDGQAAARREGRAGLHARRSRRCRSASGTTPTAPSTAPPTSRSFPDVWRHGDWCEMTAHGGIVIYGRSDAMLNPGGVRIGTAEIYRQVEQLDEVLESARHRPGLAGRRAGRAVRASLREGLALDDALVEADQASRSARTPRRATCRRRSCRSPTSRAPRAARSSSSRCAIRARPPGEEPRGARQSRGARALPGRPEPASL